MTYFCSTCPMAFDTQQGLSNHKKSCKGLILNLFGEGVGIPELAMRFKKTTDQIEDIIRGQMVRRKRG